MALITGGLEKSSGLQFLAGFAGGSLLANPNQTCPFLPASTEHRPLQALMIGRSGNRAKVVPACLKAHTAAEGRQHEASKNH